MARDTRAPGGHVGRRGSRWVVGARPVIILATFAALATPLSSCHAAARVLARLLALLAPDEPSRTVRIIQYDPRWAQLARARGGVRDTVKSKVRKVVEKRVNKHSTAVPSSTAEAKINACVPLRHGLTEKLARGMQGGQCYLLHCYVAHARLIFTSAKC